MIQFDNLRISGIDKTLRIQVSVLSESYYTNVYIDKVIIDNQNSYTALGPSYNYKYMQQISGDQKSITLVISDTEIIEGLKNNILYVYVQTKGTPAIDTPCGEDNINTLGIVYNIQPFYLNIMSYIKELGDTCQIPTHFIDAYLQMKGLEMAVRTGNYTQANKLWDKIKFHNNGFIKPNCGCNG